MGVPPMDRPTGRYPAPQPDGQKTPQEEQFDRFFDAVRRYTAESPIRALDATFRRLALTRVAETRLLRGEGGADSGDRRRRDGFSRKG